jgi:murein DD-endopeptidase MepM/ murein hydrolase activator NlpD
MPVQGYYRERAPRPRRREEPRADSLTVCLTIQIIAVLLLLLAVWLLKRNSPAAYEGFQGSYHAMTADPAPPEGGFFAVLGDAWKQAEELVYSLPFLESPAGDTPPAEAPGEAPGYDYLRPSAMPSPGSAGQAPPPENALLSPVVISAALRPPVTGTVTSPFAWRIHPLTQAADFHTGLDIAAAEGRAILAALPGEVSEVGESEIYGNYIVLRHGINLETSYSHCSEIIAGEGMRVRQGERIAKVGQTGAATGPHLHFSVIAEGLFVDPRWALGDSVAFV